MSKEEVVAATQEVTPVVETKKVLTKKATKPVKWFVQEAIDKRKEK